MTPINNPYACLDCKHCWLDAGERGYSELTPSSPMSWECYKGHFDVRPYELSGAKVKSVLEIGANCPDFEAKP